MNDHDLDRSYSAMCQALASVGPERSELFLAMLCLSLISRQQQADDVLPLIEQAQARCQEP